MRSSNKAITIERKAYFPLRLSELTKRPWNIFFPDFYWLFLSSWPKWGNGSNIKVTILVFIF